MAGFPYGVNEMEKVDSIFPKNQIVKSKKPSRAGRCAYDQPFSTEFCIKFNINPNSCFVT